MQEKKRKKKANRPNGPADLSLPATGLSLIEGLSCGVVLFDTELRIVHTNGTARQLLTCDSDVGTALDENCAGSVVQNWYDELSEAIRSGNRRVYENIACDNNGLSHLLHITCVPICDGGADPTGGILLLEDITARMAMVNDLAAAERLAAVGKLAAKVAHELNNPLDGILRYINLAARVIADDGDGRAAEYLHQSRKGLLRMVQIISELLEFSRSTYSACEQANINKITEDAIKDMESQAAGNHVKIVRNYRTKMPNIRSGNLFQVFCNLIKNAIDAMEQQTDAVLEIKTFIDKSNVWVEFADTGCGLSPEVHKKLFEPFFTTKAAGKGTGLGLAICKDITDRYGGQISAENRRQGGSVFRVSIPLERTDYGRSATDETGKTEG